MSLYDSGLRKLLFRLDSERVHNLALGLIARGIVRGRAFRDARLEQTLYGVKFPNPLGLAAGFDKNGVALPRWESFGFGFVEAGTVTWHPQPGNPKPRLFRLPQDQALINRMGFNNAGAEAFAASYQPAAIPVGINLGKSKVTPVEEAAHDYRSSYARLKGLGDYFVVNVSSPNTPGLRSLQEKGPLLEIIQALRAEDPTRPLFVKVAPDLSSEALDDVVAVAHEARLTGLIATNTTLERPGLRQPISESGGLSGAPLRARSNEVLRHLAKSVDPDLVLIGVGGVFTGRDLLEKIASGAHLAQVYTGWVYGGPAMAARCLAELLTLLEGRTLAEAHRSGLG